MRTAHHLSRRAFTLVEMLVAVSLVTYLMIILFSATDAASRAWRDGQARTDAYQNGRTTLEIMAREITPAVVDTRMQFVVAPGKIIANAGAPLVDPKAPALLWMAPLGEDGGLRCVGYYLQRDEERKFFRLKRLLTGPEEADGTPSPYFPLQLSTSGATINPRSERYRTDPTDARWFTRHWNESAFNEEDVENNKAIVSTVADGVIALWVQCYDLLGQPIPLVSEAKQHPRTELAYNSAAYFQMATSEPFEPSRQGVLYLAETPQTMKANRVPQAVEITIVTLDQTSIKKAASIPQQTNELTATGTLDVEASLQALKSRLQAAQIYTSRTFSTRARLINGN